MTDEAAAAPPPQAVVAPLIEICYGIFQSTSAEVIYKINEGVSHNNKQIELDLVFPPRDSRIDSVYELFKFDATLAMQNKIVENSRHIKKIEFWNRCSQQDEHIRCFTYLTRIVRGMIGNGKHLRYINNAYEFEFELEQANQLADALRSNNNDNNCSLESFDFDECNLTPVTVQPLWDALLDSGVRTVVLANSNDSTYHNNIDFTGMETNESLKELNLAGYDMREEDCRNLFHSMKVNKGLIKLQLDYFHYKKLSKEVKRLFQEMMRENVTLLDCILRILVPNMLMARHEQDGIFALIKFHMKVNRMWKRYIMKREREKKTRTIIPRIEEGDHNNNEEEERKKRFKMRLLLHLFMKKPVLRNTILFHLLSEYPDELVSNNNHDDTQQQQSPLLLRISSSSSNLAKHKRKRTTDDDDDSENKSNEGTNDPNDNDGVTNVWDW